MIGNILFVLYLLIGLFFGGMAWRISEEIDNDTARSISYIVAISYVVLWPILFVVGLGRNLADKVLEDEDKDKSSESTGEEMGVRD